MPFLTFLGIEVDTVSLQLHLLKDKLVNLKDTLGCSVQHKTIFKKRFPEAGGGLPRQTIPKKISYVYTMQDIGSARQSPKPIHKTEPTSQSRHNVMVYPHAGVE